MNNTANLVDEVLSHRHTRHCWFDHEEARWVCAPDAAPAGDTADPADPADPADAADPERPLVDVRDMVVVHTAMLREFRLARDAVSRVAPGDAKSAARVDQHLGLLCDLLHHHHTGEDELLWPPLRERLAAPALALLDEAEGQHAALDRAIDRVTDARRTWAARVDDQSRAALNSALATLHSLLAEHLDDEERTLLPLAAAHLTEGEWRAVGAAGAAAVPKSKMLLVFGMFAYEGDPAVLADMLHAAPAPARKLVSFLAPRVYRRHAAQLYGTTSP